MTSPKFKVVYGGKEHTQYTDAGKQYPILTLEDAQYWSDEIQSDDLGDVVDIVEIETGTTTYAVTLAIGWDRNGAANHWQSLYCQTQEEVQKFRATTAIQNSAEEFLVDAGLL